ncbi:hypothetical protein HNP55_004639 [Paucibacter oligotrophus]|uniref:Ice-binding protein C-terminal domain-containing protein n=1 Tax=Roseateles oligotrophus TaxID=1769250 RepID=A0A840LGA6_9BURK|nr:PEP-CTERM sorting domain-containing protein [Roseateles oligotrophus]MBB4846085.1 hypothetical protein [Roseateles oligotrophus]
MKMIKHIAAAAALLAAVPAFAAIQGGVATSQDGELYFTVFDQSRSISYTKDLGQFISAFRVAADNVEAGYSKSFSLAGDANWTSFLAQADASQLVWNVTGHALSGGTQAGKVKLLTTIKNGDEALVADWTNQKFSFGISSATVGTFLGALNPTGTHGVPGAATNYAINGSSVNKLSEGTGNAYFGKWVGEYFNGNATFSNSNAIGASAAFDLITRTGTDQLALVNVNPFANSQNTGKWTFAIGANGPVLDYTLAAVAAPVPEPTTYALLMAGLLAMGFVVRRRNQA